MRLGIIVGPIVFVLWLYCVIDVIMSRDDECRYLPRIGWLLIVLFFPLVGSLAWLLVGRDKPWALPWQSRTRSRSTAPYPEYDRPGRATATDAAADEEFLRQCRERAEEQRRRYREQRAAERAAEDGNDGAVDQG